MGIHLITVTSEIFMEEGTFELNMECTEHGWADSET